MKQQCRATRPTSGGDYECRAWHRVHLEGPPVAAGPVCEPLYAARCATLKSLGLTCDDVAVDAKNGTKMACRTLDGNVTASKHDPAGFCLDDTASGTKKRSPVPTP